MLCMEVNPGRVVHSKWASDEKDNDLHSSPHHISSSPEKLAVQTTW